MNKKEIITLYDYNYWANGRILEATARLTPEQFTAPADVSFGSVRGTLVHALATETIWRKRCQDDVSPPAMLTETDLPTFARLKQFWSEEEASMRIFLGQVDENALSSEVHYSNTKGTPFKTILWHILLHTLNHSTQFRSEAGVILTKLGHSPGDLDMIIFLRER